MTLKSGGKIRKLTARQESCVVCVWLYVRITIVDCQTPQQLQLAKVLVEKINRDKNLGKKYRKKKIRSPFRKFT